ncbi:permease prefix domain 1-containing protein [Streptomyces sp. 4N509B]|uniref:permease prefix domain 1-containing protein n=1 Tax=Streptomyces sp. 4N509B TaxID=3457413 RepID=UPI003FCF0661
MTATGRADAGRAHAGRANAGRANAGQADAGRDDAGRDDAGRDDAVAAHAAALAAALHGPARAKARMVEEIRDGLADTVAAYTRDGWPYDRAAEQAVEEFGTPDELAPSCQRELTVAQTRHTAWTLALTTPFLFACWYLIWAAGAARVAEGPLPRAVQLLALNLAGVAATAALLGVVALATTGALGRRLRRPPRRLSWAVAWFGTVASVAMVVATLALALLSPLAATWPLLALALALSAAAHALVASSARACRRCARLTALVGAP